MTKSLFNNTATEGDVISLPDYEYTYNSAENKWEVTAFAPTFTFTSDAQINGLDNAKEVTISTRFPSITPGSTVVIPAGFWVWSDDTSVPALTVDVDNITIVNNGNIIGKGGNSGGFVGGAAILITSSGVRINNQSGAYIAGGGGGGQSTAGGGGAGGGDSIGSYGNRLGGSLNQPGSSGNGGGPNEAGGSGGNYYDAGSSSITYPVGSGGGRILPGIGGSGLCNIGTWGYGGGAGGSAGDPGSIGCNNGTGGGGGWGAAGGGASGGAGGAAISGPYTQGIWLGTVYGI